MIFAFGDRPRLRRESTGFFDPIHGNGSVYDELCSGPCGDVICRLTGCLRMATCEVKAVADKKATLKVFDIYGEKQKMLLKVFVCLIFINQPR